MITVRLSGFPHEIERFMQSLSKSNTITVTRVSSDYSNKGNQYIRRYIDIEFTSDNDCPKLSNSPHSNKEGDNDD